MALSRGELGRATDMLHQSEAVAREAKDTFTQAANLYIQATVTQLLGDDRRTANLLRESIGLSAALRNTWALSYRIVQLGGEPPGGDTRSA